MKPLVSCLFCVFVLGVNSVQGQEQVNKKVAYTDSMEEDLDSAILYIGKQKGLSDAEIEQTMGVGLFENDIHGARAEKHFKKAVKLDPRLYKSWYSLGLLHIDSEEGVGYFRKAIEVKVDYAPAYYWIAYYYTRYGNFKKALPVWKDYLRVAAVDKAKGDKGERGRIKVAQEVVKEIESGKEGEELRAIHLH